MVRDPCPILRYVLLRTGLCWTTWQRDANGVALGDRSGACLVACCAIPCGCPVDRPTDHRGAHRAPVAGLDSPHAVSRTIRIRSAEPNLVRFPACCYRRGGFALLPASWIRLARTANHCWRWYGRRPHSRRIHPYAATSKKPVLRNGPWCGVGVSLLLPNLGPEYRSATVGPTRRNSAVAPEATARSHESLQRTLRPGYAPGVGKSYRMLDEARRVQQESSELMRATRWRCAVHGVPRSARPHFCSARWLPSKGSIVELYAGSLLGNCADRYDAKLISSHVQVRFHLYAVPVDGA